MGIVQLLTRGKTDRLIESLAGQIAANCHQAVQKRLGPQVASMGRAEARGYIRARAAAVIADEVEHALASQPQLPWTYQDELRLRATNQVVQRVTHDLFFAAPHQQIRRAA